MSIEKVDDRFVIPCREWAAVHLGLDITYSYKNKRNATRAVRSGKRNHITQLCHYMQKLYARVCHLEIIMMRISKEVSAYSLDASDSFVGSDSGEGDKAAEGGGEGSIEGGPEPEGGTA